MDVPREAQMAFTGVSGTGKSSLAFGTLYAEAQRETARGGRPKSPAKESSEYVRHAVVNFFLAFELLSGWRHVEMTDLR